MLKCPTSWYSLVFSQLFPKVWILEMSSLTQRLVILSFLWSLTNSDFSTYLSNSTTIYLGLFGRQYFFSVDYLGKIESGTANILYSLCFEVQHLEMQQGNNFSILCLLKYLFIFSCWKAMCGYFSSQCKSLVFFPATVERKK